MIVYHWTTQENAISILREGLRKWSFICRKPSDWHGKVCLEIDLLENINWENRDEHAKWQAIVHERIPPERICLTSPVSDRFDMVKINNGELR